MQGELKAPASTRNGAGVATGAHPCGAFGLGDGEAVARVRFGLLDGVRDRVLLDVVIDATRRDRARDDVRVVNVTGGNGAEDRRVTAGAHARLRLCKNLHTPTSVHLRSPQHAPRSMSLVLDRNGRCVYRGMLGGASSRVLV